MEDMVAESVKYTILGMGVVFAFLYTLVLVLRLQKKIIARFFPFETSRVASASTGPGVAAEPADARLNKKRIAAVTAAIMHHKKQG